MREVNLDSLIVRRISTPILIAEDRARAVRLPIAVEETSDVALFSDRFRS